MTAIEIKTEITKGLEQLHEEALSNVLSLVNELLERSAEEIKHDRSVRRIIAENKGLLERLAK